MFVLFLSFLFPYANEFVFIYLSLLPPLFINSVKEELDSAEEAVPDRVVFHTVHVNVSFSSYFKCNK